jgi:lysophospholipase L1-like esterase
MIYMLIGFTATMLLSLLSVIVDKTFMDKVKIVFYASLIVFTTLELILNSGFLGYKTYSENNAGRYLSFYSNYMPGNNHTYWLNGSVNNQKSEFQYVKYSNSLGFVDLEWPLKKQEEEIRIIALGDSFTEGDGAHFDSSYVAALRRLLPENYSVMNAGICGSDPVFNFKNLEDKLLPYQPDHVLQTISADDIRSDFRIRGGFERFETASKKYFRSRPWWEPIYAVSYVSRIFFSALGYDQTLQRPLKNEEEEMLKLLMAEVINKYSRLGQQNGFTISIILLPTIDELCYNFRLFDLTFINNLANQYPNIKILNLGDCYLERSNQQCDSLLPYFWPLDKHHNAAGYQMMAECIAVHLMQQKR